MMAILFARLNFLAFQLPTLLAAQARRSLPGVAALPVLPNWARAQWQEGIPLFACPRNLMKLKKKKKNL